MKIRLKYKLIAISALSKIAIMAAILLLIPYMVKQFSINKTDINLERKLDNLFVLIDSLGIDNFIENNNSAAFGSYNIFKQDYVSIEPMQTDTLLNYITFSERIVDNDIINYRVLCYSFNIDNNYYLIEIGESVETVFNFEKKIRQFSIIALIALLILSITVEIIFIRVLLKPLDNIIENLKISNIPIVFNYSKVKTNTIDFEYLQQTIHNLMHKIENAFSSEREFIGNVSHELLTPVSIIRSKLDNITNYNNIPEPELKRIYDAKKMLGRLTIMIRSLLLLSRIENSEFNLTIKLT